METKTGARHSAGDAKLIQNIHDHAVALGAMPPSEKRIKTTGAFI